MEAKTQQTKKFETKKKKEKLNECEIYMPPKIRIFTAQKNITFLPEGGKIN